MDFFVNLRVSDRMLKHDYSIKNNQKDTKVIQIRVRICE